MGSYVAFLRALRGLFAADEVVTRRGFRAFVNAAELQTAYPGIQGVGVGRRVLEGGRDELVADMRRDSPDFRVWPEGRRGEYEPVVYLEPQDEKNLVAMGYDMLSEPVRRAAMERARDTGLPASTAPLVLVYDTKQPGFIIYLARYRRDAPTDTIERRRAALEGFVYASFRADDLLKAILADRTRAGVRFAVFAGPLPKPETLLHDSRSGPPDTGATPLEGRTSFEVAGSVWTLSMSAVRGFNAGSGPSRGVLFLVTGIALSGALFAVTRAEVEARAEAERAAADLRRAAAEQLRLEEQLVHAQKMEGIGRLAGGVAHDFNNLLTAILGYAELMEAQVSDREGLKSGLREIRLAGERAAALTRQLLAFSRRQVLQPQLLDLNAVVAGVEKMLARLIGEDVGLVARYEPALAGVRADPGQLEQVLVNLAVNARDAMPKGGTLTFATANVVLDAGFAQAHPGAVPGEYVEIRVTDTGTGMSDEVRRHVFEPFFTTKEKGKGTGLGLATAYGIVKQSGGYITVDSAPERGTTFRIYLPRAEGAAASAHLPGADLPPRGDETVLLVEDEAGVRKLSLTILEAQGYTVLEAASGDEALEAARSRPGEIHLVLTDLVMPGMSGRELWERLRVLRPRARVLFMSGYTDDVVATHGVLEPGIAFLQKPFTPLGLARKVREVLDAGDRTSAAEGAWGNPGPGSPGTGQDP